MGYFYKMFQSDMFVFSDDVLFSKTGRHNYNEILTRNGPMRFTLPIHYHNRKLNELKIAADNACIQKMIKTLWQEYKGADHFHEVIPVIETMLSNAPYEDSLASFNYKCLLEMGLRLGVIEGKPTALASDLKLEKHKDERIIEMCLKVGADAYYSGIAAFDYHVEQDYTDNGIRLLCTDYQPIVYPQIGRPSPTINMSVIDYVMNCGFVLPKEWKKHG